MKKIIFGLISFTTLSFVFCPVFAYCNAFGNPAAYNNCIQQENYNRQMLQMQQQQIFMQDLQINQQRQMMQQQQEYQQKMLNMQKQMQYSNYVPQYSQPVNNNYCITGDLTADYRNYTAKALSGLATYLSAKEFAKMCNYDY